MKYTTLIFLFVWLIGCSSVPNQIEPIPAAYVDESGNLIERLILPLSEEVSKNHGITLEDYNSPSVMKDGEVWIVFYEEKSSCLGCHFSVSINEIELTTMYSPGR